MHFFFQSYTLFRTGDGDELPLDLTSCLQVVGESGQVDADQSCNLATEAAASSCEKVVLNLIQDGRSYIVIWELALLAKKS